MEKLSKSSVPEATAEQGWEERDFRLWMTRGRASDMPPVSTLSALLFGHAGGGILRSGQVKNGITHFARPSALIPFFPCPPLHIPPRSLYRFFGEKPVPFFRTAGDRASVCVFAPAAALPFCENAWFIKEPAEFGQVFGQFVEFCCKALPIRV